MEGQNFKLADNIGKIKETLGLSEMKFTKFFDVKSPVTENVQGNYNNAGVDLFMPRVSQKFLISFLEANQQVYSNNLSLNICDNKDIKSADDLYALNLEDEDLAVMDFEIIYNIPKKDQIVFEGDYVQSDKITLVKYSGDTKIFQFFERMQIPLGIAIEIPTGCYVDLRSKSSNFKNGFYEIAGLIDSCYTYGMGVQLIPFHGNLISVHPKIKSDEKITQIVLNQYVTIYNFVEYSQEQWDKEQEIINRREKRSGGFGSTGKF